MPARVHVKRTQRSLWFSDEEEEILKEIKKAYSEKGLEISNSDAMRIALFTWKKHKDQ